VAAGPPLPSPDQESRGGTVVAVQALVEEGVREFGRLDGVCANPEIGGFAENTWTLTDDQWEEMIAVSFTGVWKTVRAAVPAMIEAGDGGSIVITGSMGGVKGLPGIGAHHVAAKHGVLWSAATSWRRTRGRCLWATLRGREV
jgi:NAD(P)-dependent dehydrogenase (short-subunit alcohol dehydrogenase family)